MKILLVEDTASHAIPLEQFFKREGHEVKTACTKDQAFKLIETESFDVAAVDLILILSTGDTVAEKAFFKGIGVVLMSASDQQQLDDTKESLELLRNVKVSSTLMKGFPPRLLLSRLEQAYAETQVRKVAQQPEVNPPEGSE